MKFRNYIFLILLISSINLKAQSIRKNYVEMTDEEKINLVNAFYQLRTGPDLINDLATFHGQYFRSSNTIDPSGRSIHFNLPDRPEMQIFFAWHRRQIFEIEQAMQELNPDISIPYWDASTDQSPNSDLWEENFLGQFDEDWNLGREFRSQNLLPTPQEVIDTQSETDFLLYSDIFERGSPHAGPHQWVAGAMVSSFSPRDPVFYLHHANVDKLWSEWEEITKNSSFISTSMLRYDNTYTFDNALIPLLNPNDIVDTRFYGTFYASNGQADLNNYIVSNTYNLVEKFYYQYKIQAGDNFIVPLGADCDFESLNEIILLPGFEAEKGSSFLANIDQTQINKLLFSKRNNDIVRNQIPFDEVGELIDVYTNIAFFNKQEMHLEIYPNPFSSKITVRLSEVVDKSELIIYDVTGRIIRKRDVQSTDQIEIINLNDIAPGIYFLKVNTVNGLELINKKIFKM